LHSRVTSGWFRPVPSGATSRYPTGRSWAWRKIRYKEITDCVVVGTTGSLTQPEALVLAQPDDTTGELHIVGLSLPLTQAQRAEQRQL
jgi:ATP-dependent DNA ligase